MNKLYKVLKIIIIVSLFVIIGGLLIKVIVPNQEAIEGAIDQNDGTYHLTMAYVGNEQADMDKVLVELNKLTLRDLNMTIDLIQMGFGEYQDKERLMLAGHDDLDILPVYYKDAASFIESGELIDLDSYLEEYGGDLIAQIGEEKAFAGKIGGFLYGIPAMKESQTRVGIVMRQDIVLKYDIDIDRIHNYEDLNDVYEIIHRGEPTMDLLVGNNIIEQVETYDALYDGFGVLLMETDEPTTVINYYESEEYYKRLKIIRDWYEKGYIMPDAAITNEANVNLIKAGNAFSYFSAIKPGFLNQENKLTGYEMVVALFDNTDFLYSQGTNFLNWSIAANSKNPVKAMEFLNYAYTSSEFMNLLNWGIEGEHYVFVDEEKTIIDFPEGINANNSKYNLNIGWELPNQFIAHIWKGNEPDIWEQYTAFDEVAIKSPAFGFIYDPTDVLNELTALSNIRNRYRRALETGSVDPDVILIKFNEELYRAGLQKVIDVKQKQLDIWLSHKN